ncbi:MAG: 3-phosphoserine/phosphohydroxythreonine transaminase [Candidatus Krumholzibacteria bacterium]|jgi:phosphoserine aminotransferase|nr:3-phosphoserine/phosphohydroxythreonine transaminase [Candidatus Krumholzibacteria bacterium]MDP6668831.1 3-phosphoserine/phosphohydroxythreonine transaminase [Candidatus Krumholzibacteria bacterium]MDP7022024.1 3-phosphoserine/phosphohydroxythreonine transaminase [Candidatus Krumholzibacteria bacterium]
MSRIFNFSAGPCTLPLAVLEKAQEEFVDFRGEGMSLIEMSHRSKTYDQVHQEALGLVRELLDVPDNYRIVVLGGGATLQFGMIPMNFLSEGMSCDFTQTGAWAKKALQDTQKVGKVRVLWDGKDANYLDLPDPASLKVDPDAAYLHITSNETIGGIQWQDFPETGNVPLFCDASSDFMSRPMDVSRFGLIYAGAQKNVGPAGATISIVREDLLERVPDGLIAYLDYRIHADKNSLFNTPPVFAIYMLGLTLQWLKEQGGLPAAKARADERAALVYGAMEKDSGFYSCPVPEAARSNMNLVWRLPSEDLEKEFVAEALAEGMSGLKGHRSVGGCRASIYNAMPLEGARALADFMGEFARKKG